MSAWLGRTGWSRSKRQSLCERAGNGRGAPYWRAYRKQAGRLHRRYLGPASTLTTDRLRAVARALADPSPALPPPPLLDHGPNGGPDRSHNGAPPPRRWWTGRGRS